MAEPVQQKHRGRRTFWVVAIVVVATIGYLAAQYFGPYTRMMRVVRQGDHLKELRAWALGAMDHQPAGAEHQVAIGVGEWPALLKEMAVNEVYFVKARAEKGVQEHMTVICGSRYYHYGLELGRAGYKPVEKSQYAYEEIDDGIWGFSPTTTEKGGGE